MPVFGDRNDVHVLQRLFRAEQPLLGLKPLRAVRGFQNCVEAAAKKLDSRDE